MARHWPALRPRPCRPGSRSTPGSSGPRPRQSGDVRAGVTARRRPAVTAIAAFAMSAAMTPSPSRAEQLHGVGASGVAGARARRSTRPPLASRAATSADGIVPATYPRAAAAARRTAPARSFRAGTHPTAADGSAGGWTSVRSGDDSPPSSSGLGLHPFKVATRVRIPLGVRDTRRPKQNIVRARGDRNGMALREQWPRAARVDRVRPGAGGWRASPRWC